MRKANTHVTTKTGQNKASPIESEIHPSHKTPFYTLCISPLQGAVTFENMHRNDASFLQCRWLFRIRFCFPSTVAAQERIQKTHMRPAAFCTNHLASCFDDSVKGAAAFSARKRAYARNRSPKVALAGKTMTAVRIPTEKTASHVDVLGSQKLRKQGLPESENGQVGGIL